MEHIENGSSYSLHYCHIQHTYKTEGWFCLKTKHSYIFYSFIIAFHASCLHATFTHREGKLYLHIMGRQHLMGNNKSAICDMQQHISCTHHENEQYIKPLKNKAGINDILDTVIPRRKYNISPWRPSIYVNLLHFNTCRLSAWYVAFRWSLGFLKPGTYETTLFYRLSWVLISSRTRETKEV